MKTILVLISALLLSACTIGGQGSTSDISPTPTASGSSYLQISSTPTKMITQNTSDTTAAVKTKNGQIVLKLYTKEAPKTVANFLKKANSGFYKGLIFHRVIPGFMAQGGDPLGNGTGGGQIASEINTIPFVRGSLGLARGGDKAISNDSQFFICFTTEGCKHLTGDYVNFGEVISGLEVLDQIKQGDSILDIITVTK